MRRMINGQVRLADGRPAAGAIVAVAWGTAPTPEIAISCDAEGRFRLPLPPGRFRLQASAPGATGVSEVDTATSPDHVEIVVEPSLTGPDPAT